MGTERKARAPNLDGSRRSRAVALIEESEHALTWAGVIRALKVEFGVAYTRQALASHRCIAAAYERRRHRAGVQAGEGLSATARRREEASRAVREEFARLSGKYDALHEQMRRWAYNAFANGLDEATLNKDLPGRAGPADGPVKRRKARQWRQSQARGQGQARLPRSRSAKP